MTETNPATATPKRGRPKKQIQPSETAPPRPSETQAQTALLRQWESAGEEELRRLRLTALNDADDKLDSTLSVAGAIMLYLSTLSARSKATRDSYHYGCRRFMWFLYQSDSGTAPQIAVVDLPTRVLLNYNQWLITAYGNTSPATIALYLTVARNLFEYLSERELTPQNCQFSKLVAGLKKQRIRASYKTPRLQSASINQVAETAYATANGTTTLPQPPRAKGVRSADEKRRLELLERRNRAIILILYITGMRRGELVKLNREDIEGLFGITKPSTAVNREAELKIIITGKGRKERVVFLDWETLNVLEEYLQLRGDDNFRPLFIQHHSNRNAKTAGIKGENYRMKPQSVWFVVRDFAAGLGIKLTPHKFRHNLATTLLNNGAQLSEVQELLGHANPATTKMIYAHYSTTHLREAFDKYRPRASGTVTD
jgi:site-specific recombinase XerD